MTSIQTPTGTWKAVPREDVLRTNPRPILYKGNPNGFWVLPWNHRLGNIQAYHADYGPLYWLGMLFFFAPFLGLPIAAWGERRNANEIMRKVGYAKIGPDQVQYGRYERHNGKLYFAQSYSGW